MNDVILDGSCINVYEDLHMMCEYAGKDRKWGDALWAELLEDAELLDEFKYYIVHHTLQGNVKVEGYSLLDMYVKQLDLYNVFSDVGKNTEACNKGAMLLDAFYMMTQMKKDPAHYKKIMEEGQGMDRF